MSELEKISLKIIISLGSNIRSKENIQLAINKLSTLFKGIKISKYYSSNSLDQDGLISNHPKFINCAVLIESNKDYLDLKMNTLRKIESEIGRIRTEDKFAPRSIDLDIIIFGSNIIKDDFNVIYVPDPNIVNYPHLYLPILDLEPEIIIPGSNKPLKFQIDLNTNIFEIQEIKL